MDKQLQLRDEMSLSEVGQVLVKSGYFQDARDASQAIVKVLAGRELGFGPIASMTGINIIQGKPALSANLMAAAVKRSGRYNFRVKRLSNEVCEIEFFERGGADWQSCGASIFTLEDARKAGTKNLEKFPRNMLYARAMSNGVRWYCPDVTGGPVYTPEEMGLPVNEDGEAVQAQPAQAQVVIHHSGSKLWERWYTVAREAEAVGVPVPTLDDAASDEDIKDEGKKLRALIDEAKAKQVSAEAA